MPPPDWCATGRILASEYVDIREVREGGSARRSRYPSSLLVGLRLGTSSSQVCHSDSMNANVT